MLTDGHNTMKKQIKYCDNITYNLEKYKNEHRKKFTKVLMLIDGHNTMKKQKKKNNNTKFAN